MAQFAQINGKTLHFAHRAGAGGRAIVFSNSLGTDMRIWDDVIAQLPPDIPVLTSDKSGHGLSEPGAQSIADHADDLIALMDHLGLSQALICGVSVGGMIAQDLAARRPDLAAGLVLCNTAYQIGDAAFWGARIAALDADGLGALAGPVIARWFGETFRTNEPVRTAGFRTMLAHTPQAGYRAVCEAIRDANLKKATATISCPTLCVAGSSDLTTPPDSVIALANVIPGATYTCLDDVGHLPCIEAPTALAALVKKAYDQLGA